MKPVWDKPYSVAAATWNHYLWVDLSALFDCPKGIDTAKTFLQNDNMIMLFENPERPDRDYDPPIHSHYMEEIVIRGMATWWLKCQHEATQYCKQYNSWQKSTNR